MPSRIFLLSPANTSGIRAKQFISPRASFEAALQYRSPEGVEIAKAFAFMSSLYFRGKIGYAQHFAKPAAVDGCGVYVITPGFGLVPPDWRLTSERMKVMSRTPVDGSEQNYRKPLERDALSLAATLEHDAEVVLLGSVASGKYVDILWPIFETRLRFPAAFAGLGDMSRGGLMLRAVRANRELEYATLDAPRHRTDGNGKIPEGW
ncbi:MAG TPA: hypothetical protein VNN25_02245 [Thermoanaerobaculia bacterium]|nr:hypothetical protein [Thermoanaerobaculia bacterium]